MLEGVVEGKEASTQVEEMRSRSSNTTVLDTEFRYKYKPIEGRYINRGFHARTELIAVQNIEYLQRRCSGL